MERESDIPQFPRLAARLMTPLPLAPLRLAAQRVVDSVASRHPALFDRMGEQADKTFLLDPLDLPFCLRLRPRRADPRIDVLRRTDPVTFDARIAGPFAALLGMLHGALDGDALFFSRDIIVEGDTEAVLALRNALDDAEIDVLAEFTASLGPLGALAERPARRLAPLAERLTGVSLTRARFEHDRD